MVEKTVFTSGADERTPSHPQYFSWINNTNEGATEQQTLINIDFFRYMREAHGMQLEIYAWDAGNLDGASGTYADFSKGKLQAQYPNGYGPIAKAAADAGFRLGVWGGADGYGDTPEEEQARQELIVSLCRDHNFALFKFDGVCGGLREEKRPAFIRTMQLCRQYSPDLVLLNHRIPLGEAEIYATTFLWGGVETYVDVHIANPITAMHHRAFMFSRGHVPGLQRLTEDHGVCLSSAMDYFEDDLIYQAFNRCLILAPEVYGNPWFLKDHELPVLASIYTLHRKYRDILVNGMTLPDSYGCNAVSRGDGKRRFIATGNDRWQPRTIECTLDETIGLSPCDTVSVTLHHPYTEFIGTFPYGSTVTLTLPPFRAVLAEFCDSTVAEVPVKNAAYTVLHRTDDGKADKIALIAAAETAVDTAGRELWQGKPFDKREKFPEFLARLTPCAVPDNAEALYETTMFALDNDSLETRCINRTGDTAIPQVKAARDAFFAQRTYVLRGCDCAQLFDGNPDTFFDARSKSYPSPDANLRINGGCLRVDLGQSVDCDEIRFTYYNTDTDTTHQVQKQVIPVTGTVSDDLTHWRPMTLSRVEEGEKYTMEYVRQSIHDILTDEGHRETASYITNGKVRYLRLPVPMDRIFGMQLFRNGVDVTPGNLADTAKANNLMASYETKTAIAAASCTVTPAHTGILAVAVNGVHGDEGVYCAASYADGGIGFPDRAPSYPSNIWEHNVCSCKQNTTHYFPVTEAMVGQEITLYALFNHVEGADPAACTMEAWLCPDHSIAPEQVEITL